MSNYLNTSNYQCEICGKNIIENEKGEYITECEHHPIKKYAPSERAIELAFVLWGKERKKKKKKKIII